ncbi:DUF4241 domain-containing protein [Algivirga pacifica]|uniref:DUF4241 domain-containing protein n=1 Tax=Algivirga pacifica TaxID=1162670 RepID=A0ABP9DI85_9BACT
MKKYKLFIIIGFFGVFGCNQTAKEQKAEELKSTTETEKTVNQTIFGEEVTFNYSDFEDLKNNKYYDRFEIGTLSTPTGQIVCTDPMYRELGLPQSWTVKPGDYPVNIYIGLEEDFQGRVAYAEIIFSQSAVTEWRMSLISEDLLQDDFEKKMNGMYPVENGLGSFSDYSVWKSYCSKIEEFYENTPEGNFYLDELEPLFKANENIPQSSRGEDWINYRISDTGNIIMFGTGYGDGFYPRYVGYDKYGNAVKLITDYIQLTYDEEK